MAQAQVAITAVDRTQMAINSAVRGMKSLERTAKVTAKAVNLAFGFFTGGVIISAFGKIVEAAKKTEEGAKSVENLKKTLQDPALLSAANTVSKALVDGFVVAAGGVAKFAQLVRSELVAIGAIQATTSQDIVESLKRELATLKSSGATGLAAAGGAGFATQVEQGISSENAARIAEIEAALKAIQANEAIRAIKPGGSSSGRPGGMSLSVRRMSLDAEAALEKKRADAAKDAYDKMIKAEAARTEMYRQFYEDLRKTPDLIETSFDATDVKIASSVQNILDEMNAADKLMEEFAKSAAQSIQSAFADFLFDPFENGLRGMLSGFLNVIRRMVAEIAAQEILKAIFLPFASGSGFFANFAKSLTGKAMGGSVSANTPYIVGERGPELFVPGTSGGIVPNNKLGMGGGVTVAPVYNIDARGATADLQRSLPGILQENNRRIFDELDRRYGIGR